MGFFATGLRTPSATFLCARPSRTLSGSLLGKPLLLAAALGLGLAIGCVAPSLAAGSFRTERYDWVVQDYQRTLARSPAR